MMKIIETAILFKWCFKWWWDASEHALKSSDHFFSKGCHRIREATRENSVKYTSNSKYSKRLEKTGFVLNLKKAAKVGYYCRQLSNAGCTGHIIESWNGLGIVNL